MQLPKLYLFILLVASAHSLSAQDALLQKQLKESDYLRTVMKPDSANGGLGRWQKKKPTTSRSLPLTEDFYSLIFTGPGTASIDPARSVSGRGSVVLETPTSLAVKNPTNRSYGAAELIRPLKGENLNGYNRFSVWVYGEGGGFYSFFVGCTLYNGGKHVMPLPGRFEGQHFVNIYPGKWQQIVWELPDLYRDSVTGFGVNIMLTGSPKGAAEKIRLYIDDMRIENVDAENGRGFNLRKNAIAFSNSGYSLHSVKQALVQNTSDAKFQLLNDKKQVVFSAEGKRLDSGFLLLDFSEFRTPGRYSIQSGTTVSKPFPIGDEAWLATAWHTLNFFYAERCGYDQPGIHASCHLDAVSVHPDGRKVPVSGGWHDAADVTQGVGNTARGGMAMLELAKTVKDRQPELYRRLLEEARWGLDWTLRTRFGDGYRDGGLIMGIWSDNTIGTKDDMQGKATNNPADNYIGAAFCANAAPFYLETDPVFSGLCRKAAMEDFEFADEMLGTAITEKNEVDLHGQATVAAMCLYRLTRLQKYLDRAIQYARVVMDCQQSERRSDWAKPLHGFFYESRAKKRILEYFHRSDEQLMTEGLVMLLADAPSNADASRWRAACRAYGDYLKDISTVMAPYGILPAAVYQLNNADFSSIYHEGDKVGMPSMEEYNAQVKKGIHLGGDFYLRRFPVAYQFRGFHAVLMGKAKAALLLADLLGDKELRAIGTRQLEYIVGFNPFAMSTIFGDGYDYPPLYGGYAGDVVGAVPVGIETFENDDEPYMPMQVNATYKEIWTFSTASVMWSCAKLLYQ